MTTYRPAGDEPHEDELAPKPQIDPMPADLAEDEIEEPGEEHVAEEDFMAPGDAAADDTVDDGELDPGE